MPTKKITIAFIRKNKEDIKIKAPTSKSVSVLNSEVEKAVADAPASVKAEWKQLKADDQAFSDEMKKPKRPARGITNPPTNKSKPTPLPRDAPKKKLPASFFGPKVGSRPPKKMSEEHKAKIRAGVKRYHAGCVGGKGKKQQVANLKAEVSKLKQLINK